MLGALLLFAPCTFGCAGARTTVVAPTAKYPVSMSRGVRDAGGELVTPARRKVVGHFRVERTAWGLVYSYVNLTPVEDLSAELNAQIAAVDGDAVINLGVASSSCGLNTAPLLDLLPFWPGCANLTVTGDIIRVVPDEERSPQPASSLSARR